MAFQGEYPITEEELYHYREPGDFYPREERMIKMAREVFYDEGSGVDRSLFLPIKPEKTAFLNVDAQNDVVRPDAPLFCPDAHRMIPRVKRVLERCREVGIRPVFIEHCHDPRAGGRYWDLGHRRYFPRLVERFINKRQAVSGTEEVKTFPAIAPRPDEKIVYKHRWDGFIGTDLDVALRGMGADTLIFSGVFAEQCVESTARHAAELEYKVIYAADLVASHLPEQHQAVLGRIRCIFGLVMSSEGILAELAKLPA